ncbi:MAG TPA: hypothetical protein VE778_04740 [Candidatus Bathyarchaeia archaeon]|jgi:hypothetical protein|nr:hypothetical protein [Candidatus Bathyarchaeia archaeon]
MSSQTPDVEVLSPKSAAETTDITFAGVSGIVPADPRCQYRYQNATRCRLRAADSESGLCAHHLRQKFAAILPSFPDDTADLSKDLLPGGKDFSSAEDLRDYLLRLLILMTEGRVSPRRASVLAYISSQLLHSHVVAEKEAEDEPQPFIFDLPRPKRD